MQTALQSEEPTSEELALQLERIADALERLAIRRPSRSNDPRTGSAGAGGEGVSSRWTFRNQGIRAALRRAAIRHAAAGTSS